MARTAPSDQRELRIALFHGQPAAWLTSGVHSKGTKPVPVASTV